MDVKENSSVSQYVVFKLEDEEYGVDIKKVTTIEKMHSITRVPKTPEYIKGVINLRGEIIPIMNLRKRFCLPEEEANNSTRIIVIKSKEISAGIIVDSVAEVAQVSDEAVENITGIETEVRNGFVFGVSNVNNRLISLLDLENLLEFNC